MSAPIFTSQKEVALTLDKAANRSRFPASSKQVWFLAGLLFKAGVEKCEREMEDFLIGGAALDGKTASFLISDLLKNS